MRGWGGTELRLSKGELSGEGGGKMKGDGIECEREPLVEIGLVKARASVVT